MVKDSSNNNNQVEREGAEIQYKNCIAIKLQFTKQQKNSKNVSFALI